MKCLDVSGGGLADACPCASIVKVEPLD